MGRLHRPYVPLAIRVKVAERQFDAASSFDHENGERNASIFRSYVDRDSWKLANSFRDQLYMFLRLIFGDGAKVELHHRPALVNREWDNRKNDYLPSANDPDCLVYLRVHDHDIETRVRGVGAQRSDLSQARYLKKVARNRKPGRPKAKIASRGFPKRPFNRRKK